MLTITELSNLSDGELLELERRIKAAKKKIKHDKIPKEIIQYLTQLYRNCINDIKDITINQKVDILYTIDVLSSYVVNKRITNKAVDVLCSIPDDFVENLEKFENLPLEVIQEKNRVMNNYNMFFEEVEKVANKYDVPFKGLLYRIEREP